MDLSLLGWWPYGMGAATLMLFPWGRALLKWVFVALPLLILALLLASEPDLGD